MIASIDLIIETLYHSAGTVDNTGSTIWCSPWKNTGLTTDAANPLKLDVGTGWDGKTKCTWFLQATDETCGIGFTVNKSVVNPTNYFVKYVEWTDTASLGTDALLLATSETPYHLGTYPATEVYLNPMKGNFASGNYKSYDFSPSYPLSYGKDYYPKNSWPGSYGDVIFFNRATTTPWGTSTGTQNSGLYLQYNAEV